MGKFFITNPSGAVLGKDGQWKVVFCFAEVLQFGSKPKAKKYARAIVLPGKAERDWFIVDKVL